jgi:SAM-dependent methyltransferase
MSTPAEQDFWQSADADAAMQDSHQYAWEAMARIEAARLPGATVLDIGCNRGGFLRWLFDEYLIGRGFGIDPAGGAIDDARSLVRERPIEYLEGERPSPEWPAVDLCFSHEVMYLIDRLGQHAQDVHDALRPGGSYVAVEGVHRDSARMTRWHVANGDRLCLPPLRGIDDYIRPFLDHGFAVDVGILAVQFLPVMPDEVDDVVDRLHYWTSEKAVFRFTRGTDTRRAGSGRVSHAPSSQWQLAERR